MDFDFASFVETLRQFSHTAEYENAVGLLWASLAGLGSAVAMRYAGRWGWLAAKVGGRGVLASLGLVTFLAAGTARLVYRPKVPPPPFVPGQLADLIIRALCTDVVLNRVKVDGSTVEAGPIKVCIGNGAIRVGTEQVMRLLNDAERGAIIRTAREACDRLQAQDAYQRTDAAIDVLVKAEVEQAVLDIASDDDRLDVAAGLAPGQWTDGDAQQPFPAPAKPAIEVTELTGSTAPAKRSFRITGVQDQGAARSALIRRLADFGTVRTCFVWPCGENEWHAVVTFVTDTEPQEQQRSFPATTEEQRLAAWTKRKALLDMANGREAD